MNDIRLIPLLGGRSSGGICLLLEVGGARILLDCGRSSETTPETLKKIAHDLGRTGGIDALLISHADTHHLGAMPYLFGKKGMRSVPVVCTLPVYKFGQICLYDSCLNYRMEGGKYVDQYGDLDDIDMSLSAVTTVKFNQSISLPGKKHISICALPSGRTIGGSIWRIRCGPAEILYTMDINLKKELVLDGASLDLLPTGPSIMIVDSGAHNRSADTTNTSRKKGKDKDDSTGLLSAVVTTLRSGGNVLIPCETAGRILEFVQLFGKHWRERNLGLYHLIFLSHMAHNTLEFARMQLEWMSDSLSRSFYNGKPNPFDIPLFKLVTNIREIDRKYTGPKLVFATEGSLSAGLSKSLLLNWGGNPKNKIIFTDSSDQRSLAADLRSKYLAPPLITTVVRPLRVELAGEELEAHKREVEKALREQEEASQRKRRQEELAILNLGAGGVGEEEDDQEEEELFNRSRQQQGDALGSGRPAPPPPPETVKEENTRKKARPNTLAKFLEPDFVMFESKDKQCTLCEYGMTNDDINFRDIQSIEMKWWMKDKPDIANAPTNLLASLLANPVATVTAPESKVNASSDIIENINTANTIGTNSAGAALLSNEMPWKLISTSQRVQFTCEFTELNYSGRADLKAIKTVTQKVNPARLVVLRGTLEDCEAVVIFAKSAGIEAYAPKNRTAVTFQVQSDKLQLKIPQSLLPQAMQVLRTYSTVSNTLVDTKCSVCAITGKAIEAVKLTGQEGVRMVKYLGAAVDDKQGRNGNSSGSGIGSSDSSSVVEGGDGVQGVGVDVDGTGVDGIQDTSVHEELLDMSESGLGVVSDGEVTLQSLRKLIEASGTQVEFRIGASGGVLVCAEQVTIRKENNNDFIIEGPPIPAFYLARKALYKQFAFI